MHSIAARLLIRLEAVAQDLDRAAAGGWDWKAVTVSRDRLLDELRGVVLPDGKNLVDLDMVKGISIQGDHVSFVLEVPAELGARMEPVRKAAQETVQSIPGVGTVTVAMTAHARSSYKDKGPPDLKIGRHPDHGAKQEEIPGVRRVIAVASGKGGVGKSTVAVNLAVAMSRAGKKVGLLDADIHGPSIPTMMGLDKRPVSPDGQRIRPLKAFGVTAMSIGLLVPPQEAVIWRGPMMMGALQQMLKQVDWGKLDMLFVDLPPGTGDVQLTLSQRFKITGAVVVCTPQEVALNDARRAVAMFTKLKTPVLGMIENMSYHLCTGCGRKSYLFGRDGARTEADAAGIPFLGEIPLNESICSAGDEGRPAALGDSQMSAAFRSIASKLTEDMQG